MKCEDCGIHRVTLSNIERGGGTSVTTASRLCRILGLSLDVVTRPERVRT
jgi:DNA-binding XRE family transcriptional regulator